MSIVDALQKAKQLHGRRADERSAIPSQPAPSDETAQRSSGRTGTRETLESLEPIQPTAISIDGARCAANRVLLPGAVAEGGARAATAYNMLRTRILHRARSNGWTCIGVTSAGQNDGKTLTSINLALSLAKERNSQVVLLDLDMRNPSVCRTLGVEPPHQLLDYFHGTAEARQVFVSIGIENLVVSGNYQNTQHASELLSSPKLPDLLTFVRRSCARPLIIVDLPPVLLTDDVLVAAPHMDAMLVVVNEGATPRGSLGRARDLLADFPVAGYVLNRSMESVGGSQYGYGYNYEGGGG